MTSSNSNEAKKVDRRSHRGWMITINNPKIPCHAYLEQWLSDGNIVFGCGQTEKGDSGTVHHQMYVITKPNPSNKNGFSLKWMKDNIHSTAAFFGREGSHQQAVDYCTLEEYKGKPKGRQAGPWTVGEWDDQHIAARAKGGEVNASKILAVKRKIDDGAHDAELYNEHFGEMLRYGKSFERYRVAMKSKHRTWQTKAVAYFGPPKTGKSKRAWEMAIANYGEDDVYPLSLEGGDTVWWDGYCGQKCVIIEEFYGQMKIAYLLKLLDRYPLLVQTKGGMTPFVAEMIIFTSNEHPKMWYGKGAEPGLPSKIPLDVLRALDRRFETSLGSIKEMKEVYTGPDNEPNMSDVLEQMEARVAAIKADAASEELAAEIPVIDLNSEGDECCEHSPDYVCDLCVPQGGEWITESQARELRFENQEDFDHDFPSPSQKRLHRTDEDQAEWQLNQDTPRPGVYTPKGGPVQLKLGFKKPRRAERVDDDE